MTELEAKIRCLEVAERLTARDPERTPQVVAYTATSLYNVIVGVGKTDTQRDTIKLPRK